MVAGCGSKKRTHIKFDILFSVNVATPTKKWPNEKRLSPIQLSVYQERGVPDYFRFWWDNEGSVKTRLEVDEIIRKREHRDMKQSWIYVNDDIEVLFLNDFNFETQPLSDKVKIICKYGDPESTRVHEGSGTEVWQFYGDGKIFTFFEDKVIKEQTVPRLGRKIKT
jgi:hypothetical protein